MRWRSLLPGVGLGSDRVKKTLRYAVRVRLRLAYGADDLGRPAVHARCALAVPRTPVPACGRARAVGARSPGRRSCRSRSRGRRPGPGPSRSRKRIASLCHLRPPCSVWLRWNHRRRCCRRSRPAGSRPARRSAPDPSRRGCRGSVAAGSTGPSLRRACGIRSRRRSRRLLSGWAPRRICPWRPNSSAAPLAGSVRGVSQGCRGPEDDLGDGFGARHVDGVAPVRFAGDRAGSRGHGALRGPAGSCGRRSRRGTSWV